MNPLRCTSCVILRCFPWQTETRFTTSFWMAQAGHTRRRRIWYNWVFDYVTELRLWKRLCNVRWVWKMWILKKVIVAYFKALYRQLWIHINLHSVTSTLLLMTGRCQFHLSDNSVKWKKKIPVTFHTVVYTVHLYQVIYLKIDSTICIV